MYVCRYSSDSIFKTMKIQIVIAQCNTEKEILLNPVVVVYINTMETTFDFNFISIIAFKQHGYT